jgi:hypothetical protein
MMILEKVPAAILAQVPLSSDCRVLVLQEEDDPQRDFPQAGRYGLLTHLDDSWQQPFSWVRLVTVRGCRLFVARLAKSYRKGDYVLVVPDTDWVDSRLRLVLDLEAKEASVGG